MQQLVANWVECVARLSSVNPSVVVLSSVCSHLTGSKSVFVCLIVRSSVGVLCLFTNAKMSVRVNMHTCVNVIYKKMKWKLSQGRFAVRVLLCWFPRRSGRQSVCTIKVCLHDMCCAGALVKAVYKIIGSGLIKSLKSAEKQRIITSHKVRNIPMKKFIIQTNNINNNSLRSLYKSF